jgi:hypothetical protein
MGKRYLFYTFLIISICWNFKSPAQVDSTNLPLFIIDTGGHPIVDEPKIDAHLKINYNENGYTRQSDDPDIYDGNIGIEIRGRYSAMLPQKPYGFETRDSIGNNLNIPLFHMPPENDWILLANFNDKTFMRNSLAFELSRQMGHYAPRTQFCEVIVNGYYQGIYVLTEKIKVDKNRIDIAKLTREDNTGDEVTGGYVFKVDYFDEYNSWESRHPPFEGSTERVRFVYHYPKPDEITPQQKQYIQQFVDQMESTLYRAGSQGIVNIMSDYMNLDSYVDYFLLNELARNVDGYKKSSYFFKDKNSNGGKLHAGPVWDFDWAWKNIDECIFGATDGSGWAFTVHQCDPWPVPPGWTVKLMKDVRFRRMVKERYQELRQTILSETYIFNYIDSVAFILEEAQVRHYNRWPILGQNVGAPEVDSQPATFEGEIDKFKNWISTRLSWLDLQFSSVIVTALEDSTKKEIAENTTCTIYPNPAQTHLYLKTDKVASNISIYSSKGKQINISYLSGLGALDISTLPDGLYIMKNLFTDGSQWTGSFIKQ